MRPATFHKAVSIRDILYRRLNLYLAAGWVVATILTGAAGTQYFNEGLRGRVIHLGNMILAVEALREPDGLESSGPQPGRVDNFLPDHADDIGVNDYFIVVIRENAVRYSTIDLPSEQLLALPLRGEIEHPSSFLGFDLQLPFVDWELQGVEDRERNIRVIVGLWQGEALLGVLTVTLFVFAVGLIVGTISLLVARRVVGEVVRPLEDSAAAVMQRTERDLSSIRLDVSLRELIQIEEALNDLILRLDVALKRERAFIANAAHELRTPLAAVRAQAEAVDTQGVTPEVLGQIDGMLEATDRATRLISQLLQLARSESAPDGSADESSIDLVELTQDLISQFTPEVLETGGELELIAPPSITVTGNHALIMMLLRNLLENAVKYAVAPLRVVVTLQRDDAERPVVSIEDNGPGMLEADFQKAFAKFERLGRKSGEGAGLGLSIVQEIVQRQNLTLKQLPADRLGGLKVSVRFNP